MLLSFSCSNYRSIKEKIKFSMCATDDQEHKEQVKKVDSIRVLRNTAIYGANGSGKSSFISAIKSMQEMVVQSMKKQPGDALERTSHKLSDIDVPTSFEMQFVTDNIRFLYGFSYTEFEIKEEYLYYYPNGRQSKIFDRDEKGITFGKSFEKDLALVVEKMLKSNRLLLSIAANFTNISEIEKVFLFLKEDIVVYQNSLGQHGLDQHWIRLTAKALNESEKIKKIFLDFLKYIGSDAKDIYARYEKKKLSMDALPTDFPLELKEKIVEVGKEEIDLKIEYDKFTLNVSEESEGIKKLFKILVPIFNVLVLGKTIIFDEIETSLHPSIVREIINLFINDRHEEFAQLIFSTHDAMLLNLQMFRRDQIWFTELKGEERSTDLYSLAEIKNVRKDENIMKGYIHGKYGAIPMINREIADIFDKE